MSSGFEVCIHREGRWEIYSFFDAHEEEDAIYQARDISNNYQAICVLWSAQMRVNYFKSRNPDEKKPKYMDVRKDLKLGIKDSKNKKIKKIIPKEKTVQPIETIIKEENKVEEDKHFTAADKQRAIMHSFIVGFTGLVLTFFSPSFLSDDSGATIKSLIMVITFLLSGFIAYLVYLMSEQTARLKNKGEDIDSDLAWIKLGISDDILKKLAKEQTPEIKNAISASFSNNISTYENQIISSSKKIINLDKKEQLNQTSIHTKPITTSTPKHDNSDFKISHTTDKENETNPEINNALAEASLREILTELCHDIKKESYDPETESLKELHDLAATLYLCGAASLAVRKLHLPQKMVSSFVPLILTRFNINPEISEGYILKLNHYINTSRHTILFERGISDAQKYMIDDAALPTYIDALHKWIALEGEATSNSFFATVIFTDIENFSQSTRMNGEKWMIDILHAHNDIVRKILEQFGGKEIKHTGDGILAMFSNVHKATDAAIAIQRGINLFSKSMPSRAFKIRVGVGAGEIVSIDGDIFGASVNLTARVMALVSGDKIAITEPVYGISKDSKHHFTDLGEKEMKGFKGQHVYLLHWQEN